MLALAISDAGLARPQEVQITPQPVAGVFGMAPEPGGLNALYRPPADVTFVGTFEEAMQYVSPALCSLDWLGWCLTPTRCGLILMRAVGPVPRLLSSLGALLTSRFGLNWLRLLFICSHLLV